MFGDREDVRRRRLTALAVTLAIHAGIAGIVILGFAPGPSPVRFDPASLTTIAISEPDPPTPPPEPSQRAESAPDTPAAEGATGNPLPVEAPKAAVVLAPAPAATAAGDGRDLAGSGSGASGTGQGAGGAGTGTGGGGQGRPAQRIAGALRDSDYPRAAEAAGAAGTVAISFRVRPDGLVDQCAVVASSGHALLDDLTCRLFTQRYRFRPALDGSGMPIASTLRTSFTWGTRRR